ncbi:MAG: lipoate--protein ligase [Bacteroidales bacterium]|nr:lipoate--protein ligase [Bacteroidales bacterium]
MNYLLNDCTDACRNMALDEYVLESLPLDSPVFWLWRNAPSVIIGLNQNVYSEVNLPYLKSHGIALARRVSGGGAVYHDLQNLNYSIVGRISELPCNPPDIAVGALRTLGVDAELSGRNDIMVEGRKCSGYAKRVSKDRILIHGTMLFDVDFDAMARALEVPGSKLQAAGVDSVRSRVTNLKPNLKGMDDVLQLRDALQGILSAGGKQIRLSREQEEEVSKIAESKFRSWEWIYGRSREASFKTSRRFPCGTVELYWETDRGILTEVRFGGDFMGGLPTAALEDRLRGLRFDQETILKTLEGVRPGVDAFFDSLQPQDIAGLFLQFPLV